MAVLSFQPPKFFLLVHCSKLPRVVFLVETILNEPEGPHLSPADP